MYLFFGGGKLTSKGQCHSIGIFFAIYKQLVMLSLALLGLVFKIIAPFNKSDESGGFGCARFFINY